MRTAYKIAGATAAALLLIACGSGSPTSTASSSPTAAATTAAATPTASDLPVVVTTTTSATPAPIQFTSDGTGPYQVGSLLSSLQAQSLVAEVATGGETCPQNTTARGVQSYADVRMSARTDGRLYLVTNRSTHIPTPSGAYVGDSLSRLNTIYAGVTHETLGSGTNQAFLVTTLSGRGILFDLDMSLKVISMSAGESDYLRSSWVGGTDFC
jgi:hypothetical protein